MMFPTVFSTGHSHLRGTAIPVGGQAPVLVDGIYDLSTIELANGLTETVAFKVSGVGPEQINEPRRVKTLTVQIPLQAVTTLSDVQSPRPIDHQIVDAVNQNAQALIEVQRLLAVLIEKNGQL